MTTKRKLTEAEYEDMALSYEREPARRDEMIGEPLIDTPILKMGRPPGAGQKRGETPVRSIRLPADMEERLTTLAEKEGVGGSEIIRRAVREFIDRHR
jgi:hypothetical protein